MSTNPYNSIKIAGALAASTLLSGCTWFSDEVKPVSQGIVQSNLGPKYVRVSAVEKPASSYFAGRRPHVDGTLSQIYSMSADADIMGAPQSESIDVNNRRLPLEAIIYQNGPESLGTSTHDYVRVATPNGVFVFHPDRYINEQGQSIKYEASAIGQKLKPVQVEKFAKYNGIAIKAMEHATRVVDNEFQVR